MNGEWRESEGKKSKRCGGERGVGEGVIRGRREGRSR